MRLSNLKPKAFLVPAVILFLMLAPSFSHALSPRIDNVVVGVATVQLRGDVPSPPDSNKNAPSPVTAPAALKVSFNVKDAFNDEIDAAIKSSIPTTFTFIVELNRVATAWFDEAAGRWEFTHTVRYDSLKEEYEIRLGEEAGEPLRTRDFQEMKRIMSTGANIILNTEGQLRPGTEYELRIKAELRALKLPFLLNYMFFFAKLWDVTTDWHIHRFIL
jgi:hypothetical protein